MTDTYEYPIGSGNYISAPPNPLEVITSGTRLFLSGGSILDIPAGSSLLTEDGFLPEDELVGRLLVSKVGNYYSSFTPFAIYAPPVSLELMQVKAYKIISSEPINNSKIKLSQLPTAPTLRSTVAGDEYIQILLASDSVGEKFIISMNIDWDSPIFIPSKGTLNLTGGLITRTP